MRKLRQAPPPPSSEGQWTQRLDLPPEPLPSTPQLPLGGSHLGNREGAKRAKGRSAGRDPENRRSDPGPSRHLQGPSPAWALPKPRHPPTTLARGRRLPPPAISPPAGRSPALSQPHPLRGQERARRAGEASRDHSAPRSDRRASPQVAARGGCAPGLPPPRAPLRRRGTRARAGLLLPSPARLPVAREAAEPSLPFRSPPSPPPSRGAPSHPRPGRPQGRTPESPPAAP
ncbi:WAS/WASL-interacting protein family member 2-like [Ursus maritimus]|uniref:WAS/WASL-interacting protein family member 2-like n=1 Tax=Ursus maritimus TaxID=29073 RepID=A0A8M1GBJ4_URSMA|nr:WAS/WASL-interacting protein family member 2-like [Ursus maritimus]